MDSTNPKTTYANPFDYYNALYDVDPVISYNYIPQAFAGHTLNEIQTMYNTAKKAADFPKPYKEIVDLTKVLSEHGITVAFVSASPIFLVAPMLQDHKLDVPLSQMEGIDVYVQDPQSNQAHPVLLSNLFQTQGITTWKEFLRSYGHYMVLPRASEIMNAREGKALGVMSVAARHVAQWNANHASAITMSDMRLALVAGDNYAPFSDITYADPEQSGNDQGMVRSLPFLSQAVVLNLYKTINTPQGIDFNKKLKNHLAYWALATQLKQYEPHLQFLEQTAIYEGKQLGFATQVPPQK